jgi:hypothetical protein
MTPKVWMSVKLVPLSATERVAGVGLAFARIRIGGPPHRQPGQISDLCGWASPPGGEAKESYC